MPRRSFTLLELVLVMIVLSALALLTVPSVAGSRERRDLDGAARSVLALSRLARARAAGEGRSYRVRVDAGEVRLVRGRDPLVAPDDPEDPEREAPREGERWAAPVALPEGVRLLEAEVGGLLIEEPPFEIAFHPGGDADAAYFVWQSRSGRETVTLRVDPLLGQASIEEEPLE